MKGNCDRTVKGAMCLHVNEETILVSSVKTSFLVKEYHQPMGNNSSGWISRSGRFFSERTQINLHKGHDCCYKLLHTQCLWQKNLKDSHKLWVNGVVRTKEAHLSDLHVDVIQEAQRWLGVPSIKSLYFYLFTICFVSWCPKKYKAAQGAWRVSAQEIWATHLHIF